MGALSREQEPPIGTWVKDRHGGTTMRHENGRWAPPGSEPFAIWEAMWDARGPLVECGPWGRALPGEEPAEVKADAVFDSVKIEQSVRVWLVWDVEAGAWVVDAPTMDGAPLEPGFGEHDVHVEWIEEPQRPTDEAIAAVENAKGAAQDADLPTGLDLIGLLRDALPAGACDTCGAALDHSEPHAATCLRLKIERVIEAVDGAEEAVESIDGVLRQPAVTAGVAALANVVRGILEDA